MKNNEKIYEIRENILQLIKKNNYFDFINYYNQHGHQMIEPHYEIIVNATSFSKNPKFLQKLQERPEYSPNASKFNNYILRNSIYLNNLSLTKFVFVQLPQEDKDSAFLLAIEFAKYTIAKYMLSQFTPSNTGENHSNIFMGLMASELTHKLKFKLLNPNKLNIDPDYINTITSIDVDEALTKILKNNDILSLQEIVKRKIIIQPKFFQLFKEIGVTNNIEFFNIALEGIEDIHYDNNKILKQIISSENPIILNRLFDEYQSRDFSIISNYQHLNDEIRMTKKYKPLLTILENACEKEMFLLDNKIKKTTHKSKKNKI